MLCIKNSAWRNHQLYVIRMNFNKFCVTAGAPTLFHSLMPADTRTRHSERRIITNKKRIESVISTLRFCLSQQGNNMQVDHGLYLHSSRINHEWTETQHQLENTYTRRSLNSVLDSLVLDPNGKFHNHSDGKWMAFGTDNRRFYQHPYLQATKREHSITNQQHVYYYYKNFQRYWSCWNPRRH